MVLNVADEIYNACRNIFNMCITKVIFKSERKYHLINLRNMICFVSITTVNPFPQRHTVHCVRLEVLLFTYLQSSNSLIGLFKIFSWVLMKSTMVFNLSLYCVPNFLPIICFQASDSTNRANLNSSEK